jgi:hypothetical protein
VKEHRSTNPHTPSAAGEVCTPNMQLHNFSRSLGTTHTWLASTVPPQALSTLSYAIRHSCFFKSIRKAQQQEQLAATLKVPQPIYNTLACIKQLCSCPMRCGVSPQQSYSFERVCSNCVQHVHTTLCPGLVERCSCIHTHVAAYTCTGVQCHRCLHIWFISWL